MIGVADQWQAWMLAASLQALVLLVLVGVLDALLLRRAWPELRAALWAVVLLKLVLPPTLRSPVSVAHAASGLEPVSWLAPGALPSSRGLAVAALVAWALGALAFLVVLEVARRRVAASWLGASSAADGELAERVARLASRLGMSRVPAVRVHGGGLGRELGPGVVGAWRPIIVVPRSLLASPAELDHALLHELAHVRRRDPLAALACTVLRAAWWFHPAAWLACARLAELRELCCDQEVARVLGDETRSYRRTLARMALRRLESPAGVLGFMHRHALILARLSALERPARPRPRWRRALTAGALSLLLACAVPLMPPRPELFGLPIPPPETLQGCMQRRYLVHGLLAAQSASVPPGSTGDFQGATR